MTGRETTAVEGRSSGAWPAEPGDRGVPRPGRRPLRLLLTMTVAGFAVGFLIMGLLAMLPPMAALPEALLGAALLTVLIVPVLYLFAFRPLVTQLAERSLADEGFRGRSEGREETVGTRTGELAQADASLRAEVAGRDPTVDALRECERRYRRLFDQSLLGVYRSTVDGRLLDCNEAFARTYGYDSRAEVLAAPAAALYPEPAGREAFLAGLPRDGTPIAGRRPGRRRDGSQVWIHESAGLVPDETGALTVVEGILFGVTGQKRAESERQQSPEQVEGESPLVEGLENTLRTERDLLEAIMEHTRAHLAYLDPEFTFLRVNSTYAHGCGHRVEDLIGRNHFELFPDPENQAIFERVRDSGESAGYRAKPFVFPGDPEHTVTYWDWTLVPVKDRGGAVHGLVLSLINVTDVMRAQQAVAVSERKYRQLIEAAREGIWVRGVDGRTVLVNEAMAGMLGYTVDEMTGAPVVGFLKTVDPAAIEEIVERRRQGVSEQFEYEFLRRDGSVMVALVHASPIFDDRGEWAGSMALVTDITERRQADEALRRAHDELEARVEVRTAELARANARLNAELAERQRAEAALRESEELLRTVLELLPVGVWIVDEAGNVVSGNLAAQRIWAGAHFVGPEKYGVYKAWRLDTGEPLPLEEWSASRALRTGEPCLNQVIEIEAFDGTRKIMDNSAVPVRRSDGQLHGALVVNEDITERVRSGRALQRYADEQKALYTVTAAASTILDPQALLDAVLDAVLPVVGADAGWVTLTGPTSAGPPRLAAHRGVPEEFLRSEEGCPLESCDACWPRYRQGGSSDAPMKLETCRRLPQAVLAATGLHSHVSIALQAGTNVVGVLSVGWREKPLYTVAERTLLEAIGVQVGIALSNAQLYQAEQRARATAETMRQAGLRLSGTLDQDAVIRNLVEALRELVPSDSVRVVLREVDGRLAVRAATATDGALRVSRRALSRLDLSADSSISLLLAAGKSVVVADTLARPEWAHLVRSARERCWMGVPLVAGREVIGICSLSKQEAGFFTDEHLRLAEALAVPAAMAIQNASLFEQVRAGRSQLQTLSRQLVEIQESERRTVSRELHDEAGQALSSLMIGLRLLEREAGRSAGLRERINELKRVADGVQEGIHRLAANLRPPSLDHLGLEAALRQYVDGLGSSEGPDVTFEAAGSARWRPSADVETALFRIAQEATTNAIRHARASRVAVRLERRRESTRLSVADDGVGFDSSKANVHGRLGLIGMRERAEAFGGRLSIESTPGRGTTTVVEVPRAHPHRDSR